MPSALCIGGELDGGFREVDECPYFSHLERPPDYQRLTPSSRASSAPDLLPVVTYRIRVYQDPITRRPIYLAVLEGTRVEDSETGRRLIRELETRAEFAKKLKVTVGRQEPMPDDLAINEDGELGTITSSTPVMGPDGSSSWLGQQAYPRERMLWSSKNPTVIARRVGPQQVYTMV